jgi:hypothetical protein
MTLLSRLTLSSSTCCRECPISFDRARRADEGADHLGILDARCALYARGNIDAAGARDADGLRNIFGIKATRYHERQLEIEILKYMPVEHRAKTAGTRCAPGCAGIEQNAIGNGGVAGQ